MARRIFTKLIMMLFVAALCMNVDSAYAKKKKSTQLEDGKVPGVVYVFGVATSFNDSVVYITDINKIDSLAIQKKTLFLPYRAEFTFQLRQYLEGTLQLPRQTACMYFSDKKQKLTKKFNKLQKRYRNDENLQVIVVDSKQFQFKHPVDMSNAVTDEQ